MSRLPRVTTEDVENILQKRTASTSEIAGMFNVSRQYASRLIKRLLQEKRVAKIGSGPQIVYTTHEYAKKHIGLFPKKIEKGFTNEGLEEHLVLEELENRLPALLTISEHIKNIFVYAFSEMFNNAIEHSRSVRIKTNVSLNGVIEFRVRDYGIGVFKNVMRFAKRNISYSRYFKRKNNYDASVSLRRGNFLYLENF